MHHRKVLKHVASPDRFGSRQDSSLRLTSARKLGWIRAAAGARFDTLELALLVWRATITDSARAAADSIVAEFSSMAAGGLTGKQVLASPYYLIGSIDSIATRLLELRERFGISHTTTLPDAANAFVPVIAKLRGQ